VESEFTGEAEAAKVGVMVGQLASDITVLVDIMDVVEFEVEVNFMESYSRPEVKVSIAGGVLVDSDIVCGGVKKIE
jgi:hypothetical protein